MTKVEKQIGKEHKGNMWERKEIKIERGREKNEWKRTKTLRAHYKVSMSIDLHTETATQL